MVVKVYLEDKDIALDILKTGNAEHSIKFTPFEFEYALAENKARINEVGLWRNEFNINKLR